MLLSLTGGPIPGALYNYIDIYIIMYDIFLCFIHLYAKSIRAIWGCNG